MAATTKAAAIAITATAGAAGRRLLVLTLLCAALAAAIPAHTKDGADGVTATMEGNEECVSGHMKIGAEASCGGNCYCLGGRWVCPETECGGEGNEPKKLRSEHLELLPLRRSKRDDLLSDTSDVTAIVIAERCVPHTRFRKDCNACLCPTSGIKARASCTTASCPAPPSPRASSDVSEVLANLLLSATTLRPCTLEEKVANATGCVPVPLDGERCAPGVTYMDECNTCICSQDGIKAHASCTFKICPK